MKKNNKEEIDKIVGEILSGVKNKKVLVLEEQKTDLERETQKLPKCFQHRINLMRMHVKDFDIDFWLSILKSCQLAMEIYDKSPDKNFRNISSAEIDEVADNYGYMSLDDKAFALSLALAKWRDEDLQNDLENSLVMNIPDPWPITSIESHLRNREIVTYHHSETFLRIEKK